MLQNHKFRLIPGGLYKTHIYRGHVGGRKTRIIIARSANEAYALMLDSLAGEPFEPNEVYADPERDATLLEQFKHASVGVYAL